MLTKEEFVRATTAYFKYQKYMDKLAELNINIWENESYGGLLDQYVILLMKNIGLEKDQLNIALDLFYSLDDYESEEFTEELNSLYDDLLEIKEDDPSE